MTYHRPSVLLAGHLVPKMIGLAAMLCLFVATEASAARRLFILSGQSNMFFLDPQVSFAPAIRKAFSNDDNVIIKEAEGGQPIRKWYRNWKPGPKGPAADPAELGMIYKRLMVKVEAALKDKPAPDTITFVWMQGEADAVRGGDVYEESLKGLIAQLRGDLKRPDIMIVIGRISDYENVRQPRPYWKSVRDIQMRVAELDPLAAWVDTDDLNGTGNGLHYTKEGYRLLGERFAAKAVELIEGQPAKAAVP